MTKTALIQVGDPAPDATLSNDLNLPVQLSELWQSHPIALVFVRHSGCTFCRAEAAELRDAYSEIRTAGGDVVLVSMDEPVRLHEFKQQLQLPFVCLSDSRQDYYRAFQCPRGNLWSVAGPEMWGRAIRSLFQHGFGFVRADPLQLSGNFVIDRAGTIQFAHRSRHSGDWASPQELIAALKSTVGHSLPSANTNC